MAERWFSDEELSEMSRPTMELAAEAIERGDAEQAKALCERERHPLYCTHCAFINELGPINWIGYPVYPSQPPRDFERDPCVWHWYKDPADIPERHWERYGLERKAAGGDGSGDGD
jgi:hypothetical protein